MNQTQPHNDPDSALRAIVAASRRANVVLDAALAADGLSVAKLGVLEVLVQSAHPLPLSQLAEYLTCVRSNITQLVDRLEADGLVRRLPDPKDRRYMRAEITDEGRRRCEKGMQAAMAVEAQLLQGLTGKEREQLASLLALVNRNCGSEPAA